jgi:hypothetical protein
LGFPQFRAFVRSGGPKGSYGMKKKAAVKHHKTAAKAKKSNGLSLST